MTNDERDTMNDYERACAWHAERQGLLPIMDALRHAGIPHTLEQTGGWCMVVAVRGEQPDYVWVTADGPEGTAFVGWYPTEESAYDPCGDEVNRTVSLSDLPATVRAFMAGDRS